MARSRDLLGPYELHPDTFLLTSKDAPDAPLQRAGHGQIVETPDGLTYHTHLCSRPLPGTRRSPLGRETAIQKCVWGDDGWLYLEHGGLVPALDVPAPAGAPDPEPDAPVEYRFDRPPLPQDFQWLRTPYPERLFTLTGDAAAPARPRVRSAAGSSSRSSPAASSITATAPRPASPPSPPTPTSRPPASRPTTTAPSSISSPSPTTPRLGRVLTILSCPGDWPDGRLSFPLHPPIPLPDGPVDLAVEVAGATQQFLYRTGGDWTPAGPALDASVISDEGGRGEHGSFTGAFVGLARLRHLRPRRPRRLRPLQLRAAG